MTQTDLIAANAAGGPDALVALPSESESQSVARMLHSAIEKGVPVETLERLVDLHERVSKRAAEQEFAAAMAQFQSECPAIPKTSTAKVVSERSGAKFDYTYAELDQIAETAGPLLHKNGFSFGWDSETSDKGVITCTCTLRHRNGHSIAARFSCPTESAAGMSAQQKFAAALTYARRQSLVQVLGLTTTDPDTDAGPGEALSPEHAANIEALLSETKADRKKFLAWLAAASVPEMREADYARAVSALEQKRAGR